MICNVIENKLYFITASQLNLNKTILRLSSILMIKKQQKMSCFTLHQSSPHPETYVEQCVPNISYRFKSLLQS